MKKVRYQFICFCFYSETRAIIAKRTIEDSKIEDSKIDFKYDDEEGQPRKKNKLENEKIVKSKKLTKILTLVSMKYINFF